MPAPDRARVRAGLLRHRVTLQQNVASGTTRTWSNLASNIPASIQPVSGWDRPRSELGTQAQTLIEIHVRGRPNLLIRPRMRILVPIVGGGNRVLEIQEAINVRELNRLWVLQCQEVTT